MKALILLNLLFFLPANAAVYVSSQSRLWPGGVIPIEWDANVSFPNRLRVVAAMLIWQDIANVSLVPRDGQADYVYIRDALETTEGNPGGSSSPSVGRAGGRQFLNIRIDLSGITNFGLAHEWGHVLGLYHTHQRTDREDFVRVYENRVQKGKIGNFNISQNSLAWPRDQMDYRSVMSYGRCIFSTSEDCGADLENCRVLEIRDADEEAEFDTVMGQRSFLSQQDRLAVCFLYPKSGHRFLERGGSIFPVGTFHLPYGTMDQAAGFLPSGGTLWIHPGRYAAPAAVISKPMTIRPTNGSVIIGLP